MRPIRLVWTAIAASSVSGSSIPVGRYAGLPNSTGPSAKKIESNFAASAICAIRM